MTAIDPKLFSTPFLSSWMATARVDADRRSPNFSVRAAGWAQHALENICPLTGAADRQYNALLLDGRFHDPRGTAPAVRPHLEIAHRVLATVDPSFPQRLAIAGNCLMFPYWIFAEVAATRRALFSGVGDRAEEAIDSIVAAAPVIAAHFDGITEQVAPRWEEVERLLFERNDRMSTLVTAPFATNEISEVFPAANELQLHIEYDARLAEKSGAFASRRVGVWTIQGQTVNSEPFSIGLVTPRLTANSQFNDPMFAPAVESPAALLVRTLLLLRIARKHLPGTLDNMQVHVPVTPASMADSHLKVLKAKVGAKLPQASVAAATGFLAACSDEDSAWDVLSRWADEHAVILTVDEVAFKRAHRNALRNMRRAEDPERDDIDVLLPLGWADTQVVRIGFSKNRS